MMSWAGFQRISDPTQHTENQLPVLKDWAFHRPYDIAGVYEEESAWRVDHQKELSRLLQDASRRRFQAVLVWALDSLSFEGPLAILSLVHRLSACGVKVLSYQESWTEAPGELAELLHVLTGWVARMKSQRRSERTKAGLARVRAQGKRLGRPPGPKTTKTEKETRIHTPIKVLFWWINKFLISN